MYGYVHGHMRGIDLGTRETIVRIRGGDVHAELTQ